MKERYFKLAVLPNGNRLFLDLKGDFDAVSADQLIEVLKQNRNHFKEVLVQTDGLMHIYASGRNRIHKKRRVLDESCSHVEFVGMNASEIAPKGIDCF